MFFLRAEFHPWEWPAHRWHRIHVDYAGTMDGRYHLIVVDAHSKWVVIYDIRCLQHFFHITMSHHMISDLKHSYMLLSVQSLTGIVLFFA